jgi:hypothetical protein
MTADTTIELHHLLKGPEDAPVHLGPLTERQENL